jgi:hypothetical protein
MMINGREYITPEEYAEKYNRDASGLRYAARHNRGGLGDAAVKVSRSVSVYPADVVEAWRATVDAGDWQRGTKNVSAITRVAKRYDLDRQVVWRAVRAGRIHGAKQDASGTWQISDKAAAAWAAEWLGITEPVRDVADCVG